MADNHPANLAEWQARKRRYEANLRLQAAYAAIERRVMLIRFTQIGLLVCAASVAFGMIFGSLSGVH